MWRRRCGCCVVGARGGIRRREGGRVEGEALTHIPDEAEKDDDDQEGQARWRHLLLLLLLLLPVKLCVRWVFGMDIVESTERSMRVNSGDR